MRSVLDTGKSAFLIEPTNLYLAASAYISAGLLGIKQRQKLRWKDPKTLVDRLDTVKKEKLGIVEAMPVTFEQAFHSLINSKYAGLQDIMGEEILDLFVLVKQKGEEYVKSLTEEQRMALYLLHF